MFLHIFMRTKIKKKQVQTELKVQQYGVRRRPFHTLKGSALTTVKLLH